MITERQRQTQGVHVAHFEVYGNDARIEVAVKNHRLLRSPRRLRLVQIRDAPPFRLLERVHGRLEAGQVSRIQIRDLPRITVQDDRVHGVRVLRGQRYPGDGADAEAGVGDFRVCGAPDVTLLEQAGQIAGGFDDALRLHFEEAVWVVGGPAT